MHLSTTIFETLFSLMPLHDTTKATNIFSAAMPPLPTVHVQDLPADLHSNLLQCYISRYGAAPWDDTLPHGECNTSSETVCGAHLATETAQYSADVLLLASAEERQVRA